MRPLSLELEGFTAFRDLQTISFEDLDLFVITGPTGAGKSSLLDAMVFALFGKVPRMGAHGLGDLVSHGLAQARIKLEFSVGGQRYRVARRLAKGGTTSATFERADGADWRPDVEGSGVRAVDRRVIELLKLDFDAFTRAVVLPQGEFQRFLRGEPDKRREVLTDLLGLKHYEAMGARARGRIRELEATVHTTQDILNAQYAEATDEHLIQARGAAESALARARALTEALGTASALDVRATGLGHARALLERRRVESEDIRAGLHGKLAEWELARTRHEKLEQAVEQAKDAAKEAQSTLDHAKKEHDRLVEQHGTVSALTKAEGAVQLLGQCRVDLGEREERLAATSEKLTELTGREQAAQDEVEALEESSAATKEAAETAERAADDAAERGRQTADRAEQAELAEREVRDASAAHETLAGQMHAARKQAEGATQQAQEAEIECERVTNEHAVVAVAQRVKAGEPCPVCQRVLEQDPDIDRHVHESIEAAADRRDRARAEANTAVRIAATAEAEAEAAAARFQRAQASLLEAFDGAEGIEALRGEATAAAQARTQLLEGQRTAREEFEKAVRAENAARVQAKELETALVGTTAEKDRLTQECEELRRRGTEAAATLRAHFADEIPADAAHQLRSRLGELEFATGALDQAQQAKNGAQDRVQATTESLAGLQQGLTRLDSDVAVLRSRCETLRDQLAEEFTTVAPDASLSKIPAAVDDREAHIGALASWCDATVGAVATADGAAQQTLDTFVEQLHELATEHEVEVGPEETPAAALRAAEQQAREDMVRAEAAVQEIERLVGKRKELEASIAESQSKAVLLRSLAAELRANRFIQYVIQQTLDLLALRASEELERISAGRYSLVSHDGEFAVIDHANADEQRSVKTLSGGETFLASLSLALALSQHVGELATEGLGAKLEAVFIDEGFGALDPETLEDVIDALERLRESNLMVGVITHVPLLAERIRVGIRVEKGQNKSSVMDAAAA